MSLKKSECKISSTTVSGDTNNFKHQKSRKRRKRKSVRKENSQNNSYQKIEHDPIVNTTINVKENKNNNSKKSRNKHLIQPESSGDESKW